MQFATLQELELVDGLEPHLLITNIGKPSERCYRSVFRRFSLSIQKNQQVAGPLRPHDFRVVGQMLVRRKTGSFGKAENNREAPQLAY